MFRREYHESPPTCACYHRVDHAAHQSHPEPHCPDPANRGIVQHILALSGSAVIIRHWFEINLDDASMEHGARIEIRELPAQPHRGSESASQLTTVARPLWRGHPFER